MAQIDGILAARAIGLPTCHRIQAAGESLHIKKCTPKEINVTAKITKCGPEPFWNNNTISKNGFSLYPFTECYWSSPHVNLNGKTYTFIHNDWIEEKFSIKLPSIKIIQAFTEIVDKEPITITVPLNTYKTQTLEQLNIVSDLMAKLELSQANTLTTIIPAETSQVNLPSFSNMAHKLKIALFSFFLLMCIPYLLYAMAALFRCIWPIVKQPLQKIAWPKILIRRPQINTHVHSHPRMIEGTGAVWDDGCPVQPLTTN